MKICQPPVNFNGIMIVGEWPGREEMTSRSKLPFIGPDGQFLKDRMKKAGIEAKDCYITYVVHQQPMKNDFASLPATVVEQGRAELIADIEKYKPNLVLAVGPEALKIICNKDGLLARRGAVLEAAIVPGVKVLPTVSPGSIFRGNAKYDVVLQMDLGKALAESKFPEIRHPYRNVEVVRGVIPAVELLQQLSKMTTPQAVDIETAGPKLLAYGIAISKEMAYVIPKELCEMPVVLRAISEYAFSDVPKIFHNGLYDVFHGAYYYHIVTRNFFYDTMLAQHCIFPTLPKSLAFCSSIYTNETYWKDEGKEIIDDLQTHKHNKIIDWEKFYIYNGKDCCVTYEIFEEQQEELDHWQTRGIFETTMACVRPALEMQMNGLRVDEEGLEEFKGKNERAVEVLGRIKDAVIGEDLNIGSPVQLKKLLYDEWRMPVQKVKGKITTNDKKLQVLEKYPTPYKLLIGLIRTLKKHTKLRDFYTIKTNPDGRTRFSVKLHGAYTGRWSTSSSITGVGMNYQNQPKMVRFAYPADPGKIYIQMDLSNAEARIVAACCEDEDWVKRFDIQDQHQFVASELFHVPFEQVTKIQRNNFAKKVAHASHYLLGWMLLSELLSCSAREAKAHLARYHEIRPKLRTWHHDYIGKEVRKTRIIRNCFGRVIQFFGPRYDDLITEVVAAEPQSTSVDYLSAGVRDMYDGLRADLMLQVHDSLLVQTDDNLSSIARTIEHMRKHTERTITVHGIDLMIPASFEIGYNWGNMVEMKDLADLPEYYRKLSWDRNESYADKFNVPYGTLISTHQAR